MANRSDGPQHLCRQGRKCKSRVRCDDGEWQGGGVEEAGKLCRPCEQHSFGALGQLWSDYQMLETAVHQPRGRIDGPKVTRTAERKIPIPLDIDSLMTAIDDETLRWAIRVTRGEPLPSSPRERVRRCVTILRTSTGTLVDLPMQRVPAWMPYADGGDYDGLLELDGVDAVLRLAYLHHRAQGALGLTEATTWLSESCHVCGLRTLTISLYDAVDAENSLVSCRTCRNVWSQAEFTRLNNPLAA